MRLLAIGLALAAFLAPFVPTLLIRLSGETEVAGMVWLALTAFGAFLSLLLSSIAFGVGREAYYDLPAPRPVRRRVELALLAAPGLLCCAAPFVVVAYLVAG